jgi:hypothetical protein
VICAFNELENAASANHSTNGMDTLKSKYRIKSPNETALPLTAACAVRMLPSGNTPLHFVR